LIRDREIQRLISYIKGIGLKVSFTSKDVGGSALWHLDNTEIVICKKYNTTKIETILSLIHETGHALHNLWEKNRKIDQKFNEALTDIDDAEEQGMDTQKRQRKIVLDNEIAGTNYWYNIYKETDMKFPIWRLEVAKGFDIWQYEVFYETGSYPPAKDRIEKRKELTNKYKRKSND
jgi:hypothetical protein